MQLIQDKSEQLNLPEVTSFEHSLGSGELTVNMTDPSTFAHAMTKLYSQPLIAAIRETMSNALDSTRRTGITYTAENPAVYVNIIDPQTENIQVDSIEEYYLGSTTTMKNIAKVNPVITISDRGTGMSNETLLENFLSYKNSTKQDDLAVTGSKGVGAKAPLAYTDEFFVTSVHEGQMNSYRVHRSAEGYRYTWLVSEDTDKPNGTEVSFAIRTDRKSSDITTVRELLQQYSTLLSEGDCTFSPTCVINQDHINPMYGTPLVEVGSYRLDKNITDPFTFRIPISDRFRSFFETDVKGGHWGYDRVGYNISGFYYSGSDHHSRATRKNIDGIVVTPPYGVLDFPESRDTIEYNQRHDILQKRIYDALTTHSQLRHDILKTYIDFLKTCSQDHPYASQYKHLLRTTISKLTRKVINQRVNPQHTVYGYSVKEIISVIPEIGVFCDTVESLDDESFTVQAAKYSITNSERGFNLTMVEPFDPNRTHPQKLSTSVSVRFSQMGKPGFTEAGIAKSLYDSQDIFAPQVIVLTCPEDDKEYLKILRKANKIITYMRDEKLWPSAHRDVAHVLFVKGELSNECMTDVLPLSKKITTCDASKLYEKIREEEAQLREETRESNTQTRPRKSKDRITLDGARVGTAPDPQKPGYPHGFLKHPTPTSRVLECDIDELVDRFDHIVGVNHDVYTYEEHTEIITYLVNRGIDLTRTCVFNVSNTHGHDCGKLVKCIEEHNLNVHVNAHTDRHYDDYSAQSRKDLILLARKQGHIIPVNCEPDQTRLASVSIMDLAAHVVLYAVTAGIGKITAYNTKFYMFNAEPRIWKAPYGATYPDDHQRAYDLAYLCRIVDEKRSWSGRSLYHLQEYESPFDDEQHDLLNRAYDHIVHQVSEDIARMVYNTLYAIFDDGDMDEYDVFRAKYLSTDQQWSDIEHEKLPLGEYVKQYSDIDMRHTYQSGTLVGIINLMSFHCEPITVKNRDKRVQYLRARMEIAAHIVKNAQWFSQPKHVNTMLTSINHDIKPNDAHGDDDIEPYNFGKNVVIPTAINALTHRVENFDVSDL